MTEREIIIEGLERRQRFKTPDGSSCVIPANLLQDALALLKAQQPRVMTLEELRQWEETPLRQRNPIFIEFRCTGLTAWRTYFDAVKGTSMGIVRCWTSRPDEKVRAETPWES